MEYKYSLKQLPETQFKYVCVVGDNELFCKMVYQQKCDSPLFPVGTNNAGSHCHKPPKQDFNLPKT